MRKSKAARVAGFVASAGLTVGLIGAAGAATGAYFTDEAPGTITGTVGSILVSGNFDTNFGTVLPGDTVQKSVWAKNDGNSPQDVWVEFPGEIAYLNGYGVFSVNGHVITSGDAVKVASNVAPNGSVELKLKLAVSGGIDNEEGGVTINGDTAPTNRTGTVPFTVIATQVGQSPS